MKPYRVVFVEAYRAPRGSQRSLALLLANLPSHVDAHVLCLAETELVEWYRKAGAQSSVELAPEPLREFGGGLLDAGFMKIAALTLKSLLPYTLRLRRRLRELEADLVHCNQERGVLLVGPAARTLGIPVIWHLRGVNPASGLLGRATELLSQRVICVAGALVEGLRDRSKARVVPNGIDAETQPSQEAVESVLRTISAAREVRSLGPGPTLVTASSLIPYKGLHHLAAALERVVGTAADCADLLWVVVGEPHTAAAHRYWRDLEAHFFDDSPLSRHLFIAGWQAEPLAWLAAAEMTLLPTVEAETYRFADGEEIEVFGSEGLPRTILESMAVGTPVIATRVAGVTDQIEDGVSGRVVPPSDSEALAAAIVELAQDEIQQRTLAESAKVRLRGFSIESMVDGTVAVHEELLGDRSS